MYSISFNFSVLAWLNIWFDYNPIVQRIWNLSRKEIAFCFKFSFMNRMKIKYQKFTQKRKKDAAFTHNMCAMP